MRMGIGYLIVAVMVSGLVVGCSSPRSVGIHIGEPDYRIVHEHREPDYRIVHRHPGPPPHAPAHGYRRKFAHHYHYYPTANVYYDRSREVYFYFTGNEWHMALFLPSSIHINVDEAMTLELETDRPYLENAKHIKHVKYKKKGPKHKRKHKRKHKGRNGKR